MLRLALIDGGTLAADYAQATARLAEVGVTAVVARDLATGQQHAAHFGTPWVAQSLAELLAQHGDAFDAVAVHAFGERRAEIAREAARAGKHVLVEWPPANSPEALDELVAVCGASGVTCMPAQSGRFVPAHVAIRAALADGKLGAPGLLRIHCWEGADAAASERPTLPLKDIALWADVARQIDLALWLFQTRPTEVYAVAQPPANDRRDYVQLHLGFPAGGMALIDCTRVLPPSEEYYSLSVIGSSGAAYSDDHHNMQLLFRNGAPAAQRTGYGVIPLVAELREFAASIREGRPPAITLADAAAALRVATAAQESLALGEAISLGYESQPEA